MRGAGSDDHGLTKKWKREEMGIKQVERKEGAQSERAGQLWWRGHGSARGALLMWWHDDDGVDDSPLVGNQREERIIITQLNYSAISPRQRQALQGSSSRLIREACGVLEDQWTAQWRGETSPKRREKKRRQERRSGSTQGWRGRGSGGGERAEDLQRETFGGAADA